MQGPPGVHHSSSWSLTPLIPSCITQRNADWLCWWNRKADPDRPGRSASEGQLRAALGNPHSAGKGGWAYQIPTRKDLDGKRKNHERGWEGAGKDEKGGSNQSLMHGLRWNHLDKRYFYRRKINSGSVSIRSWSQRDQNGGRGQDTQVRHHENGLKRLVGGRSLRELGGLC